MNTPETQTDATRDDRLIAFLLIAAGVLLNKWSLGWIISDAKTISSGFLIVLIALFQAASISAGLWILLQRMALPLTAASLNIVKVAIGVPILLGLLGTLGNLLDPATDYRYPTRPAFSCSSEDSFCNQTVAAGLAGVERYGKGTAFTDVNGDGWDDLFVADAEPRLREDYGVSMFYINNQDGSFQSADLGIDDADLVSNWTATFADYDNDGDPDMLILNGGYVGAGSLVFYENEINENGKFVNRTEESGLNVMNDEPSLWWSASWADYDNDGFVDFAANRRNEAPVLFRNNGNETFSDVTAQMGLEKASRGWRRDGKNPVWLDYDNDGDPDLYIAGIQQHDFFENLEGKHFIKITDKVFSTPFPERVLYEQEAPVVFSAAAVDINQDGAEDLYLGRQVEQDLILLNDGTGQFTLLGREFGIDANNTTKEQTTLDFENTMGLGVGDLFDDGWPDILIGSGDPYRADMDILYCNQSGQSFKRCTEVLTGAADEPYRTRGHGTAFADINHDGALDIYQNLGGHAPYDPESGVDTREEGALYVRNPPADLRTATVRLVGSRSNRDAIGARIKSVASETHYYTIRSTQAFQSLNSNAVIIALGDADTASLSIDWPSGARSEHSVRAGEHLTIREDG